MRIVMVVWSLGEGDDERRDHTVRKARNLALIKRLFTLGPAWMAAGNAVVVETNLGLDGVKEGVRSVAREYDNVFFADMTEASDVVSAGVPTDVEGLSGLFPKARFEWW